LTYGFSGIYPFTPVSLLIHELAVDDVIGILAVEGLKLHEHVGHQLNFIAILFDDFGRFFVGCI